MTITEAARRLDVHRDTIRRRIRSGKLEAYRVGPDGPIRIPVAALEELLQPAAREKAAA